MSRTLAWVPTGDEGARKQHQATRIGGEHEIHFDDEYHATGHGVPEWLKKDLQTHIAFMMALNKELRESGELVSAEGLSFPDQAKLVRAGKNGDPITDGVFPESKEFLAGYWIVDVDSAERAYKIAAKASAAPGRAGHL
jgi:hypothetical protein